VIAAINGPALGAGLGIAASCDLLLASESAVLGLPEINVGLLGGGRHTMRLLPHSKARRMMFTGQRLSGSLTDAVEQPRFSTATGLAMYAIHEMVRGAAQAGARAMTVDRVLGSVRRWLTDFF